MQKNTFGEVEEKIVSISHASELANVSGATIRNWIKTGYLISPRRGGVTQSSLQAFLKSVAGTDKLTQRANKQYKDQHDHVALSNKIQRQIEGGDTLDIGDDYESSLSDSYRNKEGVYYTPSDIISDMLADVEVDSSTTFLDPCCGSGNFLMEALEKGIAPQNIYGFDIDANAVAIAKNRILEKTGFDSPNIKCLNFLEEAKILERKQQTFSLIFTNPPWGKKLKKEEKKLLGKQYQAGKSLDTSSLFFFASLPLLQPNGYLGFLVQEAVFNIAAFEDLRKQILVYDLRRLIDYGKPFKGVLAKAQAFILRKSMPSMPPKKQVACQNNNQVFFRKSRSFRKNPKHILNFWVGEEDVKIIDRLYDMPHTTLQGKAIWGLGIVTGNNAKFCKKEFMDGHVPVYRGSDIKKGNLKDATNFIPRDFSQYQQVAALDLYQAPEKLIYKFISSDLGFYYDTQQRYILNSANLLIPSDRLGINAKQLCELLNSSLMNWLFNKLFNTHKVLRGDLEQLPIHLAYFQQNPEFSEDSYLEFLGMSQKSTSSYYLKD